MPIYDILFIETCISDLAAVHTYMCTCDLSIFTPLVCPVESFKPGMYQLRPTVG